MSERNYAGSSNMQVSSVSLNDTETKNILNQITSWQQSLKRLSSDSKISAEEKAKERQEIEKQIAELNQKLRKLRLEKKEELKEAKKEQEQKAALEEEMESNLFKKETDESDIAETEKEDSQKINISPQNIQEILEAGAVLQKERIRQSVEQKREAIENVMESEIVSDKIYGTDTSIKEEKLSDFSKKKPFELRIEEQQESKKVSVKNTSKKIIIRDDGI